MKQFLLLLVGLLSALQTSAQFAAPAGQAGSTAMAADSSAFLAWATGCTVQRGPQNIADPALGDASYGEAMDAVGEPGAGVVSLGDGGSAILTFATPITNGPGWDFAVFENSFSDTHLELAFVEVSSNGVDFVRFPSTSNTQVEEQVGGFGSLDATLINNLAGKYRAGFGTPFDLEELAAVPGLDVNAITHVKLIDVVGNIQDEYASFDSHGNKINDPWSTPFPSSGFDLEAVGVINQVGTGIAEMPAFQLSIFPNPVNANSRLRYTLEHSTHVRITLCDASGRTVSVLVDEQLPAGQHGVALNTSTLTTGLYILSLSTAEGTATERIIIDHAQ